MLIRRVVLVHDVMYVYALRTLHNVVNVSPNVKSPQPYCTKHQFEQIFGRKHCLLHLFAIGQLSLVVHCSLSRYFLLCRNMSDFPARSTKSQQAIVSVAVSEKISTVAKVFPRCLWGALGSFQVFIEFFKSIRHHHLYPFLLTAVNFGVFVLRLAPKIEHVC